MLTPAEIILRKNIVSSKRPMTEEELSRLSDEERKKLSDVDKYGMGAADWMKLRTGVKDRAFWVSRVESTKFVGTCQEQIAALLDAAKNDDGALLSRAEVVSKIMRAARDAGLDTGSASVRNPGSMARANVIIDTNAGLAAGQAASMQANTFGARLAFPAQELIRIESRNVERDWMRRWKANGGEVKNGRMVALKGDPIWIKISAFGCPYPPFDYNSGMGVEDVSFDEAVELGIIEDDYKPPKDSPLKAFNADLRSDMTYRNDEEWRNLRRLFGDQIRFSGNEIVWRQEAVKEAFLKKRHFDMDLGETTEQLKSMMPNEHLREIVSGKSFTLDSKWLHKKRKVNGLDHYSHFGAAETHKNNIGLTPDDLDLLPTLFREPDEVFPGKDNAPNSFINVLHDGSGGNYCLVLYARDNIRVKTFLRLKPGVDVQDALNDE